MRKKNYDDGFYCCYNTISSCLDVPLCSNSGIDSSRKTISRDKSPVGDLRVIHATAGNVGPIIMTVVATHRRPIACRLVDYNILKAGTTAGEGGSGTSMVVPVAGVGVAINTRYVFGAGRIDHYDTIIIASAVSIGAAVATLPLLDLCLLWRGLLF